MCQKGLVSAQNRQPFSWHSSHHTFFITFSLLSYEIQCHYTMLKYYINHVTSEWSPTSTQTYPQYTIWNRTGWPRKTTTIDEKIKESFFYTYTHKKGRVDMVMQTNTYCSNTFAHLRFVRWGNNKLIYSFKIIFWSQTIWNVFKSKRIILTVPIFSEGTVYFL